MMVPVPPSEPSSGRSSRTGSKCGQNVGMMVIVPPSEPPSSRSSRASSKCGGRRLVFPASAPRTATSPIFRRRSCSCDDSNIATKYSSSLRQFSQARGLLPPLRPSTKIPNQSEEELLDDLKGYNGKWKQQRAGAELERLADQKRERDLQDRLILEKKQRRQDQAVLKAIEQEEEEERQKIAARKREMEYAEQQKAEVQRKRKHLMAAKIAEEERRSVVLDTCETCSGTGLCQECSGKGCHSALLLSAAVWEESRTFDGQAICGCEACGGRKVDAVQGHGLPGTGKCCDCKGFGFKASAEVEASNRRERRVRPPFARKHIDSGQLSETPSTSTSGSECSSDTDESDVDGSVARDEETFGEEKKLRASTK